MLEGVSYAPILVAASAVAEGQLKHPPVGFGFLIPRTEGLSMLGTLFSSNLFPNRAPAGQVLLTSFLGGALRPEALDWPDRRVWETVESELKEILGVEGNLRRLALFRYRTAIPQYRLGHSRWRREALQRIQRHEGLYLTGNYLGGVSVPASMEEGRRAANAVIEYVRRTS